MQPQCKVGLAKSGLVSIKQLYHRARYFYGKTFQIIPQSILYSGVTKKSAPPFSGTPAPRILGYTAPPFQFSQDYVTPPVTSLLKIGIPANGQPYQECMFSRNAKSFAQISHKKTENFFHFLLLSSAVLDITTFPTWKSKCFAIA